MTTHCWKNGMKYHQATYCSRAIRGPLSKELHDNASSSMLQPCNLRELDEALSDIEIIEPNAATSYHD
ncbi:hypothetical protein AKJ16_DCAP10780 [Drosera capensis]